MFDLKEIQLALDATSGAVLIPEDLDKTITNLVIENSTLLKLLYKKEAKGDPVKIKRRIAVPAAHFGGEKADPASANSSYEDAISFLKKIKTKGGIYGFTKKASKEFTDALSDEIEGQTIAVATSIEATIFWGKEQTDFLTTKTSLEGDQYQFNGYDSLLTTNRVPFHKTMDLDLLGKLMFAATNKRGADKHKERLWIMSSTAQEKLISLLSALHQALPTNNSGWAQELLTAYRNLPIYNSTCTTAIEIAPATITATASSESGSLTTAKTYKYKVAAVTNQGEQAASAEASRLLADAKTSILLGWAANRDAFLYKIYRTVQDGATGTEVLEAIIPGYTYDADGNVNGYVTSWLSTKADGTLGADLPLALNDETILLLDLNLLQSQYLTGFMGDGDQTEQRPFVFYELLSKRTDAQEFMLTSYLTLAMKFEGLNAIARGVKTA
jgi:hypothetical protein